MSGSNGTAWRPLYETGYPSVEAPGDDFLGWMHAECDPASYGVTTSGETTDAVLGTVRVALPPGANAHLDAALDHALAGQGGATVADGARTYRVDHPEVRGHAASRAAQVVRAWLAWQKFPTDPALHFYFDQFTKAVPGLQDEPAAKQTVGPSFMPEHADPKFCAALEAAVALAEHEQRAYYVWEDLDGLVAAHAQRPADPMQPFVYVTPAGDLHVYAADPGSLARSLMREDVTPVAPSAICEALTESKATAVADDPNRPLAKQYVQYVTHHDVSRPAGPGVFTETLGRSAYRIVDTLGGIEFHRARPKTDELYRFPSSVMEGVLAEIDRFWTLNDDYAKLGALHHRGILLEGPPGTGKTSLIHQVAEMMVERGDVVFYARRIRSLIEALNAFRQVEATRPVVVVLEDADEHVKYDQNDFLQLLDGDQAVDHVCYLATTNYLESFPPRLRRPGRFDHIVHVGPPPIEGRQAYLQHKLGKFEKAQEITRLAKVTEGFSFGHLRELVLAVYALKEPVAEVVERLRTQMGTPMVAERPMRESVDEGTIHQMGDAAWKSATPSRRAHWLRNHIAFLKDQPKRHGTALTAGQQEMLRQYEARLAKIVATPAAEAVDEAGPRLTDAQYLRLAKYRFLVDARTDGDPDKVRDKASLEREFHQGYESFAERLGLDPAETLRDHERILRRNPKEVRDLLKDVPWVVESVDEAGPPKGSKTTKPLEGFTTERLSGRRTPIEIPAGTPVLGASVDLRDVIAGEPVTWLKVTLEGKTQTVGVYNLPVLKRDWWKDYFAEGFTLTATLTEVSPPGFSGTVAAMKKHGDIANPYALAWAMYKKGAKPHKPVEKGKPGYVTPRTHAARKARVATAKKRRLVASVLGPDTVSPLAEGAPQWVTDTLATIGGRRGLFMLGAKDMLYDEATKRVLFRIGRNASGANVLTIQYDVGSDLYNLALDYRTRSAEQTVPKVKADAQGVDAEAVGPWIERHTGMRLSLGTLGRTEGTDEAKAASDPRAAYVARARKHWQGRIARLEQQYAARKQANPQDTAGLAQARKWIDAARASAARLGEGAPEGTDEAADLTVASAEAFGRRAFAAGTQATPAKDAAFQDAWKAHASKATGAARAREYSQLLTAWAKGWHAANMAAPVSESVRVQYHDFDPTTLEPRRVRVTVTEAAAPVPPGLKSSLPKLRATADKRAAQSKQPQYVVLRSDPGGDEVSVMDPDEYATIGKGSRLLYTAQPESVDEADRQTIRKTGAQDYTAYVGRQAIAAGMSLAALKDKLRAKGHDPAQFKQERFTIATTFPQEAATGAFDKAYNEYGANAATAWQYVRTLRNDAKRKYAQAYLDYVVKRTPKPDAAALGLSTMGAQAVRMNLADFGIEEAVTEAVLGTYRQASGIPGSPVKMDVLGIRPLPAAIAKQGRHTKGFIQVQVKGVGGLHWINVYPTDVDLKPGVEMPQAQEAVDEADATRAAVFPAYTKAVADLKALMRKEGYTLEAGDAVRAQRLNRFRWTLDVRVKTGLPWGDVLNTRVHQEEQRITAVVQQGVPRDLRDKVQVATGDGDVQVELPFNAVGGRVMREDLAEAFDPAASPGKTASGKTIPAFADPAYTKGYKFPKITGDVSPARGMGFADEAAKAIRRNLPDWSKQDHLDAHAAHTRAKDAADREWGKVRDAEHQRVFKKPAEFTDYKVSGIGRDEYSREAKDRLRALAHGGTQHADLALAHRKAAVLRGGWAPKKESLDESATGDAAVARLDADTTEAAYVIGVVQKGVVQALDGQTAPMALPALAKHEALRDVHFTQLLPAVEALVRKGLVARTVGTGPACYTLRAPTPATESLLPEARKLYHALPASGPAKVKTAPLKGLLSRTVWNRVNVSDKGIVDGKHQIQLVGGVATAMGQPSYTLVTLEDLSMADMQKLAQALGVGESLTEAMFAVGAWQHVGAQDYADKCMAAFGEPNAQSAEAVTWHDEAGFDDITVRDEFLPHDFPRPHHDFVYGTRALLVPAHLTDEFAAVSGSILIDGLKGTVTARCGSLLANAITLGFVADVLAGTAKPTKAEYAKRILGSEAPPWFTDALREQPQHATPPPGSDYVVTPPGAYEVTEGIQGRAKTVTLQVTVPGVKGALNATYPVGAFPSPDAAAKSLRTALEAANLGARKARVGSAVYGPGDQEPEPGEATEMAWDFYLSATPPPSGGTDEAAGAGGAKVHKGIWYWPTAAAAKAWASANEWPTDRIIPYERGFAVQAGKSGNYAGPGETPKAWGEGTDEAIKAKAKSVTLTVTLAGAPGPVQATYPVGTFDSPAAAEASLRNDWNFVVQKARVVSAQYQPTAPLKVSGLTIPSKIMPNEWNFFGRVRTREKPPAEPTEALEVLEMDEGRTTTPKYVAELYSSAGTPITTGAIPWNAKEDGPPNAANLKAFAERINKIPGVRTAVLGAIRLNVPGGDVVARWGTQEEGSTKGPYPFTEKEAYYRRKTMAQLLYAKTDAAKSRDNMRGHDAAAENWYADDVHTILKEISRRKAGGTQEPEETTEADDTVSEAAGVASTTTFRG